MGKCVSKDQHLHIREIDERSYLAIIDEIDYYHRNEGQSESKKSSKSKKMSTTGAIETKGTSISFGFKKKIHSTSNKKQQQQLASSNGNRGEKDDQKTATIISNHNVIKAEQNQLLITNSAGGVGGVENQRDDNGNNNSGGENTSTRQVANRNNGSRFGFRQNMIRPTASSITPKFNEFDNTNNNNTTTIKNSAAKNVSPSDSIRRRSKSALASTRHNVTFAQPSPVKESNYEHHNISSRPQITTTNRFTLHSTNLPRPQYPVPVRVSAVAVPPPYRRSTTFTAFSSSPSRSSLITTNQIHATRLMDTKGAKHAANVSKRAGVNGRRDDSLDSGIASASEQQRRNQKYSPDSRQPRQRLRQFEMVPSGRHKFEIRDLREISDNAVVVPLELPKLPTTRAEIVTGGLCRSITSSMSIEASDMSISTSSSTRPTSMISTTNSEAESCEEEKFKMDTSSSEKSMMRGGNSNEARLKQEDCSIISDPTYTIKRDDDDEDLSEMTITADHTSYLDSVTLRSSPTKDEKETVNDAFMRQPKMASIRRREFFMEITDTFAETVTKARDSALLDDETSPTDSLVSSSESGEMLMKKTEKTQDDGGDICKVAIAMEQDLEDISPVLDDFPSPGTPTHASNSLSLSDGNRDDFLIDDEIADQPALVFNDKKHNQSNQSNSMNMASATSTLREISINSHGSMKSINKAQLMKIHQASPASNRRTKASALDRSGSLDTLSPCDSIASDDLMADFEINSSLDSIDRPAAMSIDDIHNTSDVESRNSRRDNAERLSSKFQQQQFLHRRHSSRDNVTSQLPARATRLLSRRLQNTGNSPQPSQNGSDSPRSMDSHQNRTTTPQKTSLREHLKQRQQLNLQLQNSSSSEDLVMDKTLRNSMLQDVTSFRKELLHLRRVLQEDEDNLMRSDTLNPFDQNGQIFASNLLNGNKCDDEKENENEKERKDDENNVVLSGDQLAMLEDQREELSDLRRQVVYLQSQMADKDRTIRLLKNDIEQMGKEKGKNSSDSQSSSSDSKTETVNSATQTERLRPISMGQECLSSNSSMESKESSSSVNNQPKITVKPSMTKSKTQISSVYTKLSSIKPTTNVKTSTTNNTKPSSIPSSKTVKTTQIGISQPSLSKLSNETRLQSVKLAKRIPQLVKPGMSKSSSKSLSSFPNKNEDSNGNSANSSVSTSSSNSSLNGGLNVVPRRYI